MSRSSASTRQRSTAALDHAVDVDRAGVLQRVVALQPGQFDDLLDQPAQPGRLDPHPAGEPLHGLRVVGGLGDRVGEQDQRADRGLQLVADVDGEVAADGVQPAFPGPVLHQHEHQLAAQRRHPGTHVLRGAEPAADDLQVLLADLPVPADRADHGQQVVDHQPLTPDDAEHVGRGAGLEHLVLRAHHDRRRAQYGQHGGDTGRYDGSGDTGILRWERSLSIIAPSESRARAAPMTPPSTAASVGSTAPMLRGQPGGKDRMSTG